MFIVVASYESRLLVHSDSTATYLSANGAFLTCYWQLGMQSISIKKMFTLNLL